MSQQLPSTDELEMSPTKKDHIVHASYSQVVVVEKVGFFAPEAANERRTVRGALLPAMVIFLIVFFITCSFFLGASYKPYTQLANIDIWVIDFDNGTISEAFQNFLAGSFILNPVSNLTRQNLIYVNGYSEFPNGINDVYSAVSGGYNNIWGAIVINPLASQNLSIAQSTPYNVNYNSQSVFTLVYDEGRSSSAMPGFVIGPMRLVMAQFAPAFQVQTFFAYNAKLSNEFIANVTREAALANPAAIAAPVAYTETNVHPVGLGTVNIGATTIAVIFMFVTSMNAGGAIVGTSMSLVAKVRSLHIFAFRLVVCFVESLFLAIVLGANVAIFDGVFARGWGIYFLVLWLSLFGFMLSATAVNILIPVPNIAGIVNGLLLVINVSSAEFSYPIQLSDPFYYYGYIFPFHSAVQAGRTVLFGSYDRLYQDLPILAAWVVGPILVMLALSFRKPAPPPAQKQ